MKQIRRSVFETNSSMTHSLVICENGEYDKWLSSYDCDLKDGDSKDNYYLFNIGSNSFKFYKEAIKENIKQIYKDFENGYLNDDITEEDIKEYVNGNKSLSEFEVDIYDYWVTEEEFNDIYYWCERDDFEYTTKSGDKLTGFCYYGHD